MLEIIPNNKRLMIDGLVWDSDGDGETLIRAGLSAVNLTIQGNDVEHDFEAAMDQVARWLVRVRSPGSDWLLVERAADILSAREQGKVGLIMGWQNMRPIADKIDRLALLHRTGLRIMQLTYNTRNFLGDGCIEPVDGGLSALGYRAIGLMNELGIAIDLSHCSERTTVMAAEASTKPVLITHCGAKGVANWQRNKSDGEMRAVVASGGVVGISLYGPIIWSGDRRRPPSLDDYRRHIEYVVDLVGIDHVAMGTDFFQSKDMAAYAARYDMSLDHGNPAARKYSDAFGDDIRDRYPSDCKGLEHFRAIIEVLARNGWSDTDLDAFLGANLFRALQQIWGE
jgi:membrane dipeptidase